MKAKVTGEMDTAVADCSCEPLNGKDDGGSNQYCPTLYPL